MRAYLGPSPNPSQPFPSLGLVYHGVLLFLLDQGPALTFVVCYKPRLALPHARYSHRSPNLLLPGSRSYTYNCLPATSPVNCSAALNTIALALSPLSLFLLASRPKACSLAGHHHILLAFLAVVVTQAQPLTMTTTAPDTQRRSNWVTSYDNVYYRPRLSKKPSSLSVARFPAPLIGPRRSRPQAIHIISYPSGYVPRELRQGNDPDTPPPPPAPPRAPSLQPAPGNSSTDVSQDCCPGGSSNNSSSVNTKRSSSLKPRRRDKLLNSLSLSGPSEATSPACSNSCATLGGIRAGTATATATATANTGRAIAQSCQSDLPCQSAIGAGPAGAGATRATSTTPTRSPPAYDDIHPGSPAHDLIATSTAITSTPINSTDSNPHGTMAAARVSNPSLTGSHNMNMAASNPNRSSFMSVRSSKSAVTSCVAELPKPVASGSGVSCSILLAEQNIFLSGFDHDGHGHRDTQGGTALLRGRLQLRVTKNVKIKAVQLKLLGRARTEWPEGIPPLKQDVYEEESLRTQVLTFFNAMNDGWESDYGNQCTYKLKNASPNGSSTNLARPSPSNSLSPHRNNLTAKEMKRLSLQSVQSRSFNKGDSPIASATQAKGYKVFYPGVYDYSFELPIDHHQLETTKLQYGSVKWELQATVDRAGAFKPNLHGTKEVSIVRVPDQLSLEMSEPISISRQWEDQLHYDIVISGKSFPIGSKIPIAFKLTPLAKVQVHKLKVYVTESIEYWTNDKRVTRKDPGRKILLLEKSAGKPLESTYASSEVRTLRGGELTPEQRRQAREVAARRRTMDAARRQTTAAPLPEPTANLLGDIDLGLETFWGSTEIEANVQIPTCEMMAKNKDLRLHPDCSWKNVNVFHWIKVRFITDSFWNIC